MTGLIRKRFDLVGTPILAGLANLLFILESKFRLRKRVQSRTKRIITNAVVSIPAFALLRFMFLPAMVFLAGKSRKHKLGVNAVLPGSSPVKEILAFIFLDYTNYLWHVLNHKVPALWRFHLVHHTDKDLDLSTAFRFHFGEMVGSLFYRGAATFISGASPLTVLVYEIIYEGATEFHHSNTKLPGRIENAISKVIVTPRMHGIHHSVIRSETDSNFSVIFSFWDRLHRTFNLDFSRENPVIGVPEYQDSKELTIKFLWKLPFTSIRKRKG
jgi:sterol desaturase/sphingolipid hydroxylase (fatty acid hydroxylase superfamily)